MKVYFYKEQVTGLCFNNSLFQDSMAFTYEFEFNILRNGQNNIAKPLSFQFNSLNNHSSYIGKGEGLCIELFQDNYFVNRIKINNEEVEPSAWMYEYNQSLQTASGRLLTQYEDVLKHVQMKRDSQGKLYFCIYHNNLKVFEASSNLFYPNLNLFQSDKYAVIYFNHDNVDHRWNVKNLKFVNEYKVSLIRYSPINLLNIQTRTVTGSLDLDINIYYEYDKIYIDEDKELNINSKIFDLLVSCYNNLIIIEARDYMNNPKISFIKEFQQHNSLFYIDQQENINVYNLTKIGRLIL